MESETNLKTIDGDSRRNLYFLLALLIVAFGLRLYLAITTAYLWDEDRDWIPLAESISFEPGAINLPVRGDFHGALSAYFIKAGAFLIGNTHLGYRFFGLLAGVVTIVVVYRLAFEFAGAIAAKLSAVFIAFNEYHIQVSTMAIQKVYYLLFAGLAIYGFCRFLREQSPRWLYLAAVAVGLAFLCYEISWFFGNRCPTPQNMVVVFKSQVEGIPSC
ncbi:MAG: ArnT family glycosyltransferase [Blastocatellales bacterium]